VQCRAYGFSNYPLLTGTLGFGIINPCLNIGGIAVQVDAIVVTSDVILALAQAFYLQGAGVFGRN
jgi:hypothetical protein